MKSILVGKREYVRKLTGKKILDQDILSNIWRNTLSQIPSVFGRLVYLSSLRNQNSGRYEHHGLSQVFGEEEANKALKKNHAQAFTEWLSFNIEQQKADLDLYVAAVSFDKKTVLETWVRLKPYRNLMPNSVRSMEKRLYLSDFETILKLLTNEYDVAGPGRGASQHR